MSSIPNESQPSMPPPLPGQDSSKEFNETDAPAHGSLALPQ
jgi:hypothetical protein